MNTKIIANHPQCRVSNATLHCEGPLDWSSYRLLVGVVIEEIRMGAEEIIVDLSHVERISLAGMIGLYISGGLLEDNQSLTFPIKDEQDLDQLDGWEVIHDFYEYTTLGVPFKKLHLAGPNQGIIDCLTLVGLNRLFRVMPKIEEPAFLIE